LLSKVTVDGDNGAVPDTVIVSGPEFPAVIGVWVIAAESHIGKFVGAIPKPLIFWLPVLFTVI
jgi:hypothetical protein